MTPREEALLTENAALKARLTNLEWHYGGCAAQRHVAEQLVVRHERALVEARRLLDERDVVIGDLVRKLREVQARTDNDAIHYKTYITLRDSLLDRIIQLLREAIEVNEAAWLAPAIPVLEETVAKLKSVAFAKGE